MKGIIQYLDKMEKEKITAEIEKLEKRVEFLYQRGCNDEKVNTKLRQLRKQRNGY